MDFQWIVNQDFNEYNPGSFKITAPSLMKQSFPLNQLHVFLASELSSLFKSHVPHTSLQSIIKYTLEWMELIQKCAKDYKIIDCEGLTRFTVHATSSFCIEYKEGSWVISSDNANLIEKEELLKRLKSQTIHVVIHNK